MQKLLRCRLNFKERAAEGILCDSGVCKVITASFFLRLSAVSLGTLFNCSLLYYNEFIDM